MTPSQFEMSLADEIRECELELDRILPRVSYLKGRIETLRALDSMRQEKQECQCRDRGVWVHRPSRQEIITIGD